MYRPHCTRSLAFTKAKGRVQCGRCVKRKILTNSLPKVVMVCRCNSTTASSTWACWMTANMHVTTAVGQQPTRSNVTVGSSPRSRAIETPRHICKHILYNRSKHSILSTYNNDTQELTWHRTPPFLFHCTFILIWVYIRNGLSVQRRFITRYQKTPIGSYD